MISMSKIPTASKKLTAPRFTHGPSSAFPTRGREGTTERLSDAPSRSLLSFTSTTTYHVRQPATRVCADAIHPAIDALRDYKPGRGNWPTAILVVASTDSNVLVGSQTLHDKRRARPLRFASGDIQHHHHIGCARESLLEGLNHRRRLHRNMQSALEAIQVEPRRRDRRTSFW